MITYVNTVLVSNADSISFVSAKPTTSDAGKFVIINCDPDAIGSGDNKNLYIDSAPKASKAKTIKVGLVTSKTVTTHVAGTTTTDPVIKWSNIIKVDDIKSLNVLDYSADTEDTITINLSNLNAAVVSEFAKGGKRIIVRLTFKDLPTRYRKWTESYEYVTPSGDVSSAANILTYKRALATGIANLINKEWKRARVSATTDITTSNTATVILTALPYDDDDAVDTLNWAAKVRFNANIYYTDPAAEGWESKNKFFPTGVTITKVPGKQYAASAKLVRDRESQGLGYDGILNRGNGTWPIIKPAMQTDLSKHYNAVTLEFENMYRAADDIFRKTKQTLEIYAVGDTTDLKDIFDSFIAQKDTTDNA